MNEHNTPAERTAPVPQKHRKQTTGRKKEMILLVIIAVLAVIAVAAAAIGIPSFRHRLEGKWKLHETVYCFKDDQTGYMQVGESIYRFRYSVSGDQVSVDFQSDSISDCLYQFSVRGSRLILNGKDGTVRGQYIMERQKD